VTGRGFRDSLRLSRFGAAAVSTPDDLLGTSRLAVVLEPFATIPGPRAVRRIAHPLAEILLLAVCGTIAQAIRDAGADYLLAVKADQPGLRAEIGACFAAAPPDGPLPGGPAGRIETPTAHDTGHGRIEQSTTSVLREIDWLSGDRHFALNLVRAAKDTHPFARRRKVAGWDTGYLDDILNERIR